LQLVFKLYDGLANSQEHVMAKHFMKAHFCGISWFIPFFIGTTVAAPFTFAVRSGKFCSMRLNLDNSQVSLIH